MNGERVVSGQWCRGEDKPIVGYLVKSLTV